MRDFDTNPYSPDERRVANWLCERTGGAVGGGEDPIGFILSSFMAAIEELKELRKEAP